MVPTSFSSVGTWQTASQDNGNYTVSVEATDVDNNKGVNKIEVCVENP